MGKYKMWIEGAVIALSFLMSTAAMGGAVFAPTAAPGSDAGSNGDYPPSSFGSPPVNGLSIGFAAQQAMDMDAPDEESGQMPGGSRGLASVTSDSSIVTSQSAPAGSQDIPASVVARRGVQEVSVIASDLGYFPKTIFVSRSVPVRMYVTSASKNTLCFMMDSFGVRKQVKSGKIDEITFVPNVPGQYRFYCPVNGMEGTMIVKEFSTPFQLPPQTAEERAPMPSMRSLAGQRESQGTAPAIDPAE